MAQALKDSREARFHLASALTASGEAKGAVAELKKALALSPNWVPAANYLAWVLATSCEVTVRDSAEAVRLAESAASSFTNK